MWRLVRRIGRVLAWIVLSTLLVVLLAVITLVLWARSASGRRVLLARGVSIAQRQLAGRLTVGALEGDLTREIALRRVRVYDREHQLALAVDTVHVDYDLLGLVSRRVRVRALTVEGARARVRRLRDGQLNVSTLRRKTSGPEAPAKDGSPRRGWDLEIEAMRVDAEILADAPAPRTPLHARVAASGALDWQDDPRAFHGRAELVVLPAAGELRAEVKASMAPGQPFAWDATIHSRELDPALLVPGAPHGRLALAASSRGSERTAMVDVEELALDAAGTHASMRGFVALAPTLSADLRAEAHSPDLARLVGFALPDLHGSLDGHAHLLRTPAHTDVDASLSGRRLHYGDVHFAALDGHAHFEEQDGRIVARAHAQAAGARRFVAELRAHGVRLRDQRAWAADLTLDRLAVGDPEHGWRLRAPGRVRVDDRAITAAVALSAGEQTKSPIEVDAEVSYREGQLAARSDARIAGGVLHGQLSLGIGQAAPLALSLRGRSLDLTRLPVAAEHVHAGLFDVALDVHGTRRAPEVRLHAAARGVDVAAVQGVDLTLDCAYRRQRATLTVDGTIRHQPVLAVRAASRFDAAKLLRGHDAPITADVTVPAVDLSRLGHFGGTVEATASLGGTVAHPTGRAELHGRELELSELRFARLDAHAAWDGAAIRATLDGQQPTGGALHVDASLPAAADAALHATLRAQSFTFAINDVGRVHRLEGALAADLRIAGSRSHPLLGGFLRIDHGAFAGGNDPRLFRDLTLRVEAHDDAIELRELAVRVGDGTLTAHGRVALVGWEPAELDLVAEAERFPFDPTSSEAWVNATIKLHGHRVGPRLVGELSLSQGRAKLPAIERRRQIQGTGALEDVVYTDVPAPDPASAAPAAPPIDLIARIPGPFTIESPELHAQLRGELEVRTVDGKLGMFGHAETMAGRFQILGREYEIEHARASFDGGLDPVVDVRVTRAIGDTKLIISVHGTAAAPQLELASEPPVYNPSQVLGFVVSGDPEDVRVNSTSTERQLAGGISAVLVNQLKGQLLSGLPLDVIQIDPTAGDDAARLSGARVELGKYLRRNVYVSYVQHFGATVTDVHRTNTHELRFQLRLRRRMVLGVHYGDAGIGAIDFAWTFRY